MLRFIFFVRFECANSIWRVWVLTCKSRNITPLGIVATLTRPQEFKRIVKWRVFSRLLQSKKNFYCCFCEIQSTFNIFIHISLRNNINIRGKQSQLKKRQQQHKSIRIFFWRQRNAYYGSTKKSFTCPGYMEILRGKRICGYANDPTHILNIKENTNLPFVERVSLGLIGNLNRAETLNAFIQTMSFSCQPWNWRFATLNSVSDFLSIFYWSPVYQIEASNIELS